MFHSIVQQKNEAVSQALKQAGTAKLCLLTSSNVLQWEGKFKRVLFPEVIHMLEILKLPT